MPYKACPLCNCTEAAEIGTFSCTEHKLYSDEMPPTMTWMQCKVCAHQFTDGYFGPDINAVLFSRAQTEQLPGYQMEVGRSISARIVDRVTSDMHPANKLWVDVGFGNAALLATAQEYGFNVIGLDLRPETVTRAQQLGLDAHCKSLEEFATEAAGKVDVISLADVLEHVPYPTAMLSAARQALKPFGKLFVSCPSAGSIVWDALTLGGINPYWSELEHFHNFTRRRLSALLVASGFTEPVFSVSERYRLGMELITVKG